MKVEVAGADLVEADLDLRAAGVLLVSDVGGLDAVAGDVGAAHAHAGSRRGRPSIGFAT